MQVQLYTQALRNWCHAAAACSRCSTGAVCPLGRSLQQHPTGQSSTALPPSALGLSPSAASLSGLASIQLHSSKGQHINDAQAARKLLPVASSPSLHVGRKVLNSVQQARWGKHRVQEGVDPDACSLVQRVCQPLWDLGASSCPRTHQHPVPAQLLLSLQATKAISLQCVPQGLQCICWQRVEGTSVPFPAQPRMSLQPVKHVGPLSMQGRLLVRRPRPCLLSSALLLCIRPLPFCTEDLAQLLAV